MIHPTMASTANTTGTQYCISRILYLHHSTVVLDVEVILHTCRACLLLSVEHFISNR
jgi:hypothetical protein